MQSEKKCADDLTDRCTNVHYVNIPRQIKQFPVDGQNIRVMKEGVNNI